MFEKKQIAVLSLVLMIVVAGYLQYNYNTSSIISENKNPDAVYVSNEDVDEQAMEDEPAKKTVGANTPSLDSTNEFFSKVRLDKKITLGKTKETLSELMALNNADEKTKVEVSAHLTALVKNSEKEMKIESLIKERGYKDVVAMVGDDGSIDLIIKAPQLSSAQVAQIADIATRHGNVQLSKIHIKNMY